MLPIWKSRKFWLAVFAVVQTIVLHYLTIPPEIWGAIDGLVTVLILSIAAEDAALKRAGGYRDWDDVDLDRDDND